MFSTLALMLAAAARKILPTTDDKVGALEARISSLESQRETWIGIAQQWEKNANFWRDASTLTPRQRYDLELENRASLMASAYQQMQNASAQNAPMGLAHMGQLGQAMWCNCVPGRSQVWAAMQQSNAQHNATVRRNSHLRVVAEQNLLHALDGPIETLPQALLDELTGTPSGQQDD